MSNKFSVSDDIATKRLALLNEIFGKLRRIILNLQATIPQKSGLHCVLANALGGRHDYCHTLTLGSIVAGLGQSEVQAIWEFDEEPNFVYPHSVNHLVRVVTGISVLFDDEHRDCNPIPGLLPCVKELLAPTYPLTGEQIARLRKQREILGITEVVNKPTW